MGDLQGGVILGRPKQLPDNIESTAEFVQRADRWWKETIVRRATALSVNGSAVSAAEEKAKPPTKNVLIVSHGGLMHVLLQNLIESRKLGIARDVEVGRYRFPNASVTVVEMETNGKGTVVMFGDTTHLDVEFEGIDTNVDIMEQ